MSTTLPEMMRTEVVFAVTMGFVAVVMVERAVMNEAASMGLYKVR
jgi:hypothetical protein